MDYPKTHSGDLADLPAALNPLIVRDQWVSWRWIRNGQKWTKPPFRADSPNQHAACNNAATWCPQHAAVAAVQAGQADGVGFVLTGTNIGAIDLDDCRDPDTGEIDSWAKEIVLAAPNAYCEVTVSGTGLRIIGIACGSAQHKRFAVNTGRPDAAIEVYRQATRYITVSGLELGECSELPSIDALVDDVVARHHGNGDVIDALIDDIVARHHGNGAAAAEGTPTKKEESPPWSAEEEGRVRAALQHISAVDRQTWLDVGMALHWTGWKTARIIWDDWSKTAPKKYDAKIQEQTWRGFRNERGKVKTLASLFALAIDGGWDSAVSVSTETAADIAWNDPDFTILDDRRGELPEFPLEVFSSDWQRWAKDAAHGAGVTVDHVMVPLLGIASSLIGTARRVRASRSWSQPLTLWTGVLGFSGSGKTPGLNVTKNALDKIERERKTRIDNLRREHDSNAQRAKAAYKAWKADVAKAVEDKKPAPPMPNDANVPDDFVEPRLYVSNSTIERLAVLLKARPRGMVMICDELAGLFLNLARYTSGTDRPFWLECWNGDHYTIERIGRPALVIDYLLVGLVGGFQPDKMARSFQGDADGLYGRMLFSWPLEPAYKTLTDDIEEVEPEFQNALVRLIDLAAEEDGEVIITPVPLSPEAREKFEKFRAFVYHERGALDGREREWWAKAQAQVLRLAGTLAYLDWARRTAGQPILVPEPNRIEERFVDAAVRLVRDYFWPHARAALRQIGLSERHANARCALRWIWAHRKAEVSREDIRRDALGQRLDAEQTQQLIDALEKYGFLRSITVAIGPKGGRPARRWQVNPKLFSEAAAETAETAET